ncbi:MAG: lipoprotein-releasing ABC transporter ATP-binding protein LolD [Pseudomonadota bacterium]
MSELKNNVLIRCKNLEQYFQDAGEKVEIFKDLNFEVNKSESIAITGASGSGKSTLLYLLGGLEAPKSGQVIIDGQDLAVLSANKLAAFRNKKIGFVYQFHHLLSEFSALENVAMPLLIRGESSKVARQYALELLVKVGLEKRIEHKPSTLSGGERQRTAIARALVTQPQCLFADEPTGNLDNRTARQVYDLLLELNQHYQTSLVIVTHDEQMADSMHRKIVLHDGKIVESISQQ